MESSAHRACPAKEDLVLVAGGDAPRDASLAAHVAGCPSCAAEVEGLRRAVALARPPEVTDPGDAFNRAVWRRIARKRSRHRAGIAVASVAAVAAAAVLVWLPRGRAVSEIDIADHLDLYQHLDIIEHLDALEGLDLVFIDETPDG